MTKARHQLAIRFLRTVNSSESAFRAEAAVQRHRSVTVPRTGSRSKCRGIHHGLGERGVTVGNVRARRAPGSPGGTVKRSGGAWGCDSRILPSPRRALETPVTRALSTWADEPRHWPLHARRLAGRRRSHRALADRLSVMPVRIWYREDGSADAWRSDWPATSPAAMSS